MTHHSMHALWLLFLLANTYAHSQTIVFLQGSSRSGKSTICKAMEQYEQWSTVSSLYFSYCLDAFNQQFPELFTCIKNGIEPENIRHAITRNIYIFKKNIDEKTQQSIILAAHTIQRHLNDPLTYAHHKQEFSLFSLREIHTHIKNSSHVIADTAWYVTQENLQTLQPTPTIACVLAYCPFDVIIDRLIQQNKKSLEHENLMHYRFFKEPIISFTSLYDLSSQPQNAIDSIKKSTFLASLDAIEPSLSHQSSVINNAGFMMHELTHQELADYRNTISHAFKTNEILYIIPKIPYDLLLKTNDYTPQECAKQIINYVASRP